MKLKLLAIVVLGACSSKNGHQRAPESNTVMSQHTRAIPSGAYAEQIGKLRSDDREVRMDGLRVIERAGRHGIAALPELVRMLGDRYDGHWVARAIAHMGTSAIPALTEALKHSDPFVRANAANAFEQMRVMGAVPQEMPDQVKAQIMSAIERNPDSVAPEVKASLRSVQDEIRDRLTAALDDPNDSVKLAVLKALRMYGPHQPAESSLRAALGSRDEKVVEEAVLLLQHMKSLSPETVDALTPIAKQGGRLGPFAAKAIAGRNEAAQDVLGDLAVDPDPRKREAAADALAKSPGDPRAVAQLEKLLKDRDDAVALIAALGLIQAGKQFIPLVLPKLVQAISSDFKLGPRQEWERDRYEYLALKGMTELKEKALPAIPGLVKALAHADYPALHENFEAVVEKGYEEPEYSVAGLLGALGASHPEQVLPKIQSPTYSHNKRWQTRHEVVSTLGAMHQQTKKYRKEIESYLDDQHPMVRVRAMSELRWAGERDDKLVQKLKEMLTKEEDPYARYALEAAIQG